MTPVFTIHKLVLASTLVVFAIGHRDGCCAGDEPVLGPPTGAMCPPMSTLTYASFDEELMTR